MKQALEDATDDDRAAVSAMMQRPQRSCSRRTARGDDTPEQFDEFMAKHGEYFPSRPAERRRAARRPRRAGRGRPADAQLDDAGAARRARRPRAAGLRLPRPDGAARRSSTATCASLRPGEDWGGSERDGRRAGPRARRRHRACSRTSPTSTPSPSSSRSRSPARELDDLDLDALARQLGDEAAVDARSPAAAREGPAELRGDAPRRRRAAPAHPEGHAAARQEPAPRRRREDVRAPGRARPPAVRAPRANRSGATRQWAFGDTEPWDVTRTITNAVTPDAPATAGRDRRARRAHRDRRRRGAGDRGPHPGLRRAARRHLVLDGDGGPLGADEAHRPGAAHAGLDPVPRRRPAAHRLRSRGRGDGHRAARRARRDVGQGHEPAPRPAARQPALPQAPDGAARAAHRHRRRADVAPRAERAGLVRATRPTR